MTAELPEVFQQVSAASTTCISSISNRSRIFCVSILAVLLTACGGGGEDSGQDNGPASVSQAPSSDTSTKPTLTIIVSGKGHVLAAQTRHECAAECRIDLNRGSQVTLTVEPDAGYEFRLWNGDCVGTQEACQVVLDKSKSVRATFVQSRSSDAAATPVAKVTGTSVTPVGRGLRLIGERSSDPADRPLSYAWSIVSGPSSSDANLASTDQPNTIFTGNTEGTYVVSLVVHNGETSSRPGLHTIVVAEVSTVPIADQIAALEPGHWLPISLNMIEDVLPDQTGLECCPRTITASWNGGAYDTLDNRLLVWGGGHAAYNGNEIYAFDVLSGTWSRLSEPWEAPVSVHSYDQLEYIPGYHQFFTAGGAAWPLGSTRQTFTFDLMTNLWQEAEQIPGRQGELWNYQQVLEYDPISGKIVMIGSTETADYDPATRKWRRHEMTIKQRRREIVGAIDFNRRHFLVISGWDEGAVDRYPIDATGRVTADRTELTTTGANEIVDDQNIGLEYVADRDLYVAWSKGGDVYTLNPDSLEWTRHQSFSVAVPSDPADINSNGTFGRFQYMPAFGAFILVNAIDEPVWVYKLP